MTTSIIYNRDSAKMLHYRLGLSNAAIPMETALQEGGIYVLLYRIRDQLEVLFHWGIYLHKRTVETSYGDGVVTYVPHGSWYHVVDTGPGQLVWEAEHAMTAPQHIFRSTNLVILARLGSITPDSHPRFDTAVRQQDGTLNNGKPMTCRIWTMNAITDLCNARLLILQPGFSYEDVEKELKYEGNRALGSGGVRPAVVGLWSFGTKPR